MRIAVPVDGSGIDSQVDPRFGRAQTFLIVDTETMAFERIDNVQNLNLPQGAGIQSAQTVIEQKPDVVLTGNCGPKAFQVFRTAGVEVVVGVSGSIRQAVQDYLAGKYRAAPEANVEGHWM
ncbi:MAG: dinitrogenase iron-molybdenum cofactor biosynthesis protein [Desulfobacteraceae bacterium]|nr:MAG: dinitrogenase iron-molybdenum cofactor biosynthesis protein [Desulfobacteraceae bacterium]